MLMSSGSAGNDPAALVLARGQCQIVAESSGPISLDRCRRPRLLISLRHANESLRIGRQRLGRLATRPRELALRAAPHIPFGFGGSGSIKPPLPASRSLILFARRSSRYQTLSPRL